MISNNGLTTYKNRYLSFINKGVMTLLFTLLLIVLLPYSYLVFTYWSEMPIFIKIFWPTLLVIVIIGIVMTPLNGIVINRNSNILFVPDFRVMKFQKKDLEKIVINFLEWDNNKYSVMIKLIYKDGGFFSKDYSSQFRNMRNKKLAMSMYTITKRKVDRICNSILHLDICAVINIVDNNGNIISQNISNA